MLEQLKKKIFVSSSRTMLIISYMVWWWILSNPNTATGGARLVLVQVTTGLVASEPSVAVLSGLVQYLPAI